MGNRVVKVYIPLNGSGNPETEEDWIYTHYVRDAQGTAIATYKETFTGASGEYTSNFVLDEVNIYDSERIGIAKGNNVNLKNKFEASFSNYRFAAVAPTEGQISFNPNVFYIINDGENDDGTFEPDDNVTGRHYIGSISGLTITGTGIEVLNGKYTLSGSDIVVDAGQEIEFKTTNDVTIESSGAYILMSTLSSDLSAYNVSYGEVTSFSSEWSDGEGSEDVGPGSNYPLYISHKRISDLKLYELKNHLGNVHEVITDRKIGVDDGGTADIDYYDSDVISFSDYYPFGWVMPRSIEQQFRGSGSTDVDIN